MFGSCQNKFLSNFLILGILVEPPINMTSSIQPSDIFNLFNNPQIGAIHLSNKLPHISSNKSLVISKDKSSLFF